jgi:hypothetical protein
MNEVELTITGKTSRGCIHVQVSIDRDNCGILYLTQEQYQDLSALLQVGCFNKEIDFKVVDPYDTE